jgi:integrase/recombinase XerC
MRSRALEEPAAAALAAVARRRAAEGTRKGLAVLLGLYGGLRRSEIAELRWTDLAGDGWVRVIGKGSERQIPLHPVLLASLEALRSRRPIQSLGPQGLRGRVFLGQGGGRLHPTTVWTWVRQLSAEAGLPPVQVHVLRHTALTTALDGTHDLRAVQELAGHARPETTAGYTRVRSDRLSATVLAISYGEDLEECPG